MPLVVDKIKCLEESNESGSDDIYLIGFIGRTVAPFKTALGVYGPGNAWSDFETGDSRGTDVNTNLFTAADAVYVVMMVEKDSGRDVSGAAIVGAWRAQTDLIWKSIMLGLVAGGIPTNSPAGRASGFEAIRNAFKGLASIYMEFPKGNDDDIDIKQVTITTPGQAQTLRFRSNAEDATYDVTFKHVSA